MSVPVQVVADHLRETLDLAMLAQERVVRLEHAMNLVIQRHKGCENYISPYDCETSGRERDGDGTAEQWCDACELKAAFHD